MVKVREDYPVNARGDVDLNQWAQRVVKTSNVDESFLQTLIHAARNVQSAEENMLEGANLRPEHSSTLMGLEMADILAELQLDQEALLAAVVYRSVRENKISLSNVVEQYGKTVAKLVEGVLGMAAISQLRNDSDDAVFGKQSAEQTESMRKMLIAMVDDVRVPLIKLAERTCAIRAAKNLSEDRRRKVAREVSEIYAPLAHRLGIGHIKWELEDLGFRYLKPDDYKSIAALLDEKRLDRQDYIDNVVESLNDQIRKNHIDAEVYGRAKHIYSIWRKMQRKGIGFSEVYDIRAVRILVPTTKDCYEVLGIVHTLWRNIPNEFDDYIAAPKENGYRSLHTAVNGPNGKVIEVQIRSHGMHQEAEYGVCSHWRYKGTDNSAKEDSYEQKIEWLRQVLDWQEELGVDTLADDLGSVEQDRIYLFTPDGHIVDLPANATPLDFAYRIHTEIGHRCRGAKINGRIVPLNYLLKTGDQVEILTGKQTVPSRDWLIEGLGYINTSRARAKVRHWFGEQARDQNIADGRAVLDKELKRLAIQELNFEDLLRALKQTDLDDLYASVGSGDISVAQVLSAAQKLIVVEVPEQAVIEFTNKPTNTSAGNDVYIEGVGNLLTNIARCCSPVPGDDITGYITLTKGVSIHRKDCRNILQLAIDEPERIIQVSWGDAPEQTYAVDIMIEAYDRAGLLCDVATLLDKANINVTAMQALSDQGSSIVSMVITIDIRDFTHLSQLLARLNQLPNIASARRKH